eukprot:TRINITY_DN10516_c0_g1_i3.p1 TRINITY_DN10516_c0_g1~~TRINITY_DN10516_c0_g1_i3.p1  ORF type:complete len:216 (-),score=37.00 TRINITY_DN10516_c0_g1_i3:191-838(-)
MMKLFVSSILLSILFVVCVLAQNKPEQQALNDLYNSFGKPQSLTNKGWGKGSCCNWGYVTCFEGAVIQVEPQGLDLTGTIPTSIGNLRNLQYLDFSNNFISGTLPSQIGSLVSLKEFQLYNNNITGTIPNSIGALTNLQNLDFHNNQLISTIPNSIGDVNSFISLDLSQNMLQSPIPSFLDNSVIGKYAIRLINNNFTCPIPQWMLTYYIATCYQ